jgi:hypothetical protein
MFKPAIDKDQALKDVKVLAITGWQEVISDQGRFRILFPREPEIINIGNRPGAMYGYRLIDGETNWFAQYQDLGGEVPGGEKQLRNAYQKSVEAVIKKRGAKLLRQSDAVLNGRLGTEFITEVQGSVTYTRAFQIHSRLYTVEVDSKRAVNRDSTLPRDVQQFFDSFTFWE